MSKKERMYQKIEKHGQNLIKLFKLPKGTDAVKLCKQLFRLENKAHRLATDYCNGTNGVNSENWEALTEPILAKANKLLNNKNVPIYANGDARGYALKIRNSFFRDFQWANTPIYKDMGGFGIIAPDFREQN
jgi:hypothetical protein